MIFYPRRAWESAFTYSRLIAYALKVWRLYKRVKREQNEADTPYVDEAMRPLFEQPESDLVDDAAEPVRQAV